MNSSDELIDYLTELKRTCETNRNFSLKQKMNSLQKQIEDAGLRLHNAELNKSKFVPINEITSEKIAAHLAELKVRLEVLRNRMQIRG